MDRAARQRLLVKVETMHSRLVDYVARGSRASGESAEIPGSPPPALVQLTSAHDGLAHLVTDLDFAHGMNAGLGTYPAVCGATVLICSLASAPGSRCRTCRALRDRQ